MFAIWHFLSSGVSHGEKSRWIPFIHLHFLRVVPYYVKGYTDRFWVWANWKNRWLMTRSVLTVRSFKM